MACETGPSKIVRGVDKNISIQILKSSAPKEPYDFTGVAKILVQLPGEDSTIQKWYLSKTGDLTNASDLISNINVTDIKEGEKISGTGIPSGATVLYTPSSAAPNAQPANTIKISAPATATQAGQALVIGNIELVGSLLLGKLKVVLSEAETALLKIGASQSIEVRLVKADVTNIVLITSAITVEKSPFDS